MHESFLKVQLTCVHIAHFVTYGILNLYSDKQIKKKYTDIEKVF